ncbi:hypothetical protein CBER1_08362 [Cercospora berteroae]|uniref:Uncharacterized protein n=1 Tax=Cercospora berteroae TaxID=357750 RepID=A0A2S6CG90_9PEZI|nr:hypothetical protein CBER1_08362 [Cercospora berteroae]
MARRKAAKQARVARSNKDSGEPSQARLTSSGDSHSAVPNSLGLEAHTSPQPLNLPAHSSGALRITDGSDAITPPRKPDSSPALSITTRTDLEGILPDLADEELDREGDLTEGATTANLRSRGSRGKTIERPAATRRGKSDALEGTQIEGGSTADTRPRGSEGTTRELRSATRRRQPGAPKGTQTKGDSNGGARSRELRPRAKKSIEFPVATRKKSDVLEGIPVNDIFQGNQENIQDSLLYSLAKEYELSEIVEKVNENGRSNPITSNALRDRLNDYRREMINQNNYGQYEFELELNDTRRQHGLTFQLPPKDVEVIIYDGIEQIGYQIKQARSVDTNSRPRSWISRPGGTYSSSNLVQESGDITTPPRESRPKAGSSRTGGSLAQPVDKMALPAPKPKRKLRINGPRDRPVTMDIVEAASSGFLTEVEYANSTEPVKKPERSFQSETLERQGILNWPEPLERPENLKRTEALKRLEILRRPETPKKPEETESHDITPSQSHSILQADQALFNGSPDKLEGLVLYDLAKRYSWEVLVDHINTAHPEIEMTSRALLRRMTCKGGAYEQQALESNKTREEVVKGVEEAQATHYKQVEKPGPRDQSIERVSIGQIVSVLDEEKERVAEEKERVAEDDGRDAEKDEVVEVELDDEEVKARELWLKTWHSED